MKKKIVLIGLGGVIFLGSFFIILPFVLGIFFHDQELNVSKELSLTVVSIPDEENAYFDVISILKFKI